MRSENVVDCRMISKEKGKNGRLWGKGMRVGKRMNGVGGSSRLRTDTQRQWKRRGRCDGEKPRGRENQKSSGR